MEGKRADLVPGGGTKMRINLQNLPPEILCLIFELGASVASLPLAGEARLD